VNRHGDLAYSQITGYLLVHLASGHKQHHLPFPGGQRSEPPLNLRNIVVGCPPSARQACPDRGMAWKENQQHPLASGYLEMNVAVTKGSPMILAVSAAAASAKPGAELMPVPTAVQFSRTAR
jgi:hypothetical protein